MTNLQEKECEICGVWYLPNTSNQKYCPECGKRPEYLKRQLKRNIRESKERMRAVQPPSKIINKCRHCGKTYITYGRSKPYCSDKCKRDEHIARTVCENCKKPMLETNDQRDVNGRKWYCSTACKEEYKWRLAMKEGTVKTCPECGKQFLSNNTFCSRECYQKSLSKPTSTRINVCVVCGKQYMGTKGGSITCSDKCETIYNEHMERVRRKLKKEQAENKERKRMRVQQEFILKNGLCGICKTSYADCERMNSNFRLSPKGSVFNGSKVVKCPKFTS